MTPHIGAKLGEIAKTVLMPGDPKRAKFIAETYLENVKLVSEIRGIPAYTGTYKDKKVTIMGSGMGMPSASIYVFELIHFFKVKKIIRIGTCGGLSEKALIGDILLADSVFTLSNFPYIYNGYEDKVVYSSKELNDNIKKTSEELNIKIHAGMITTMDVFGPYVDYKRLLDMVPKEYEILGEEMEAFGLIHVANSMNIQASAMATVVDSAHSDVIITPEEREKNLNNMINLALNSIIK